MTEQEFDNLEVGDFVYFKSATFECIACGRVTAIYDESKNIYAEIIKLYYGEQSRGYNGSMTLGVNRSYVYKTLEEALQNYSS